MTGTVQDTGWGEGFSRRTPSAPAKTVAMPAGVVTLLGEPLGYLLRLRTTDENLDLRSLDNGGVRRRFLLGPWGALLWSSGVFRLLVLL